MNQNPATIEDLKEFLTIQLMRDFDRIGRDLVAVKYWDEYRDLWFNALQTGICNAEERSRKMIKSNQKIRTSQIHSSTGSLEDCPFCGSADIIYVEIYDENDNIVEDAFEITCLPCQIYFSCGDSTKEEIAELWNRRDEK